MRGTVRRARLMTFVVSRRGGRYSRVIVPAADLAIFAGAALIMVLTPGPNMIYLVSRSICQGRAAGVISLFGVIAGFAIHILTAAIGLTTLFLAIPFAFQAVKWAGALYLGWLAWQALRPGARSPFEQRTLPEDPPRKLFIMGFVTNLLNPKAALLYMSVFPQFIDPERGSVLAQSLVLGATQMSISFSVNLLIALSAAGIASWFARNPLWLAGQRYVMGGVLAGLAVRLAFEERRIA
jgi:threonine/homoserine/homoserine lactone efflux protein